MKKFILTFIVTVSLLLVSAIFATTANAQSLGGSFSLTAQNGKRVTDKDFIGKYMLVYFGFTSCPDVCPLTVKKIDDALTKLGPKSAQIIPVLITIDPERDTPEVMQRFLAPISKRFVGLTGTREEINAVMEKYKTFAQRIPDMQDPKNYTFMHAEFIFVMSPQGTFYSLLQGQQTADYIAQSLYAIIK